MKFLITFVILIFMSFRSEGSVNVKPVESPSYAAMTQWIENGGNLHQMTAAFGAQPIKSSEDPLLIAHALKKVPLKTQAGYDCSNRPVGFWPRSLFVVTYF
jgi:hypothetical protein